MSKEKFTTDDLRQIDQHGLSVEVVEEQLDRFKEGFPSADLVRYASTGDGIPQFVDERVHDLIAHFEEFGPDADIIKFTPASGAATRMFKHLYEYDPNDVEDPLVQAYIDGIKDYAFFAQLSDLVEQKGLSVDELVANKNYQPIIDALLSEEGLNYGALPKALIKFHTNDGRTVCSVEEHLVEGAAYAQHESGKVRLHFTVSSEHKTVIDSHLKQVLAQYEARFDCKYEVTFSEQRPQTDTVAVNIDNTPFRNADDQLVFRPAGHGALLENLNALDADIIYIKNIDNVVPDTMKPDTIRFKKLTGGLLLKVQGQAHNYLRLLDTGEADEQQLKDIADFAQSILHLQIPESSSEDLTDLLYRKLNRPYRVCGIVKNEGQPGGGPFWLRDMFGDVSLQIVETAQIDTTDVEQGKILSEATHFNPTDLVCAVRDHNGEKFDLLSFRDDETGFISAKSQGGKDLKAQELPGLWNGSMADWNTIFVEVPISTFNPVKTVNDLLQPAHLG